MSPVMEFIAASTVIAAVGWVMWRGWVNDEDPFEEFAKSRSLVALRESYERHDWAHEQLMEIQNLPETDPWRGVA